MRQGGVLMATGRRLCRSALAGVAAALLALAAAGGSAPAIAAPERNAGASGGDAAAVMSPRVSSPAGAHLKAPALYEQYCAECHGKERLGGTGPALLPQNLRRLRRKKAAQVIARGRPATQMPAFGEVLSPEQIQALVAFIYTPPAVMPVWGEKEIMASRREAVEVDRHIDRPLHDADPLNLFVVVESGDHHVSILDGDTFRVLHRFKSRYALHGGPKFSPDGRYVYFVSRDGWVTKFDLYTFEILAEVRAGINARNLAISEDGATLAVANYLPHNLVLLSAEDLRVEKIIPAVSAEGTSSRVSAVYQARGRKSFVAALKDAPEIWEISTDPEGGRLFALRRLKAPAPLDDFFFDQSYRHLLGASRSIKGAVVIDMDTGEVIARPPLPGLPHLGSGITWSWHGRPVMATPHLAEGAVSIIAMDDWSIVKTIRTLGPGFFIRSHENTPYAWTDVFFGPHRDKMHIIDKRTLKIARTLRPAPGKTVAHVEFDRWGKYALVSVWEKDGAVIVYDARNFREVKRIPMSRPVGKYNVWNKITFSEGTSH
jgi:mono/diheme cytochrome c family protein